MCFYSADNFKNKGISAQASIYKDRNRENAGKRTQILEKEKKKSLVKSLFPFYINVFGEDIRIIRDCGTGFYLSEKVLLYSSEMSLQRKEMPKNPRNCSFVLRCGFSAFFRKKKTVALTVFFLYSFLLHFKNSVGDF